MITTLSIAKEKLGGLRFFSPTLPENCEYGLHDFGGFIGVYDSGSGQILFFEDCLVVGELCKHIIYYVCYRGPLVPREKINVKGFTIRANDGSEVWLPVSGFQPPHIYDAFTMMAFLNKVAKVKQEGRIGPQED